MRRLYRLLPRGYTATWQVGLNGTTQVEGHSIELERLFYLAQGIILKYLKILRRTVLQAAYILLDWDFTCDIARLVNWPLKNPFRQIWPGALQMVDNATDDYCFQVSAM